MSNGRKIYQMDIKYTNICYSKTHENLPKFGFSGLKMYRLATLMLSRFQPEIRKLLWLDFFPLIRE
jgi:hypothetical protein